MGGRPARRAPPVRPVHTARPTTERVGERGRARGAAVGGYTPYAPAAPQTTAPAYLRFEEGENLGVLLGEVVELLVDLDVRVGDRRKVGLGRGEALGVEIVLHGDGKAFSRAPAIVHACSAALEPYKTPHGRPPSLGMRSNLEVQLQILDRILAVLKVLAEHRPGEHLAQSALRLASFDQ